MRQLGKIHCLEKNWDLSDQNTEQKSAPWVVFFHGYGADAQDLFPLGDIIRTKQPCNWLFPQGILEVPIGPAWTGRAWWKIDMQAIQEAASRGETRDLSQESPKDLPRVRELAFEMLKQLRVPWDQIILGGFSQGAMLATDLFLHAPETPRGLVIMSGALINQPTWQNLMPKRAGSRFFQSHGESDAVLGFKQAQKLETLLNQNGLQSQHVYFKGGHEIPPQVMTKIGDYLNTSL